MNYNTPYTRSQLVKLTLSISAITIGLLLLDDYHFRGNTYLSAPAILISIAHVAIFVYILACYNFYLLRKHRTQPKYYYLNSTIGSLVLATIYSILSHYVRLRLIGAFGITGIVDISTFKDYLIATTIVMVALLMFSIGRRQEVMMALEKLKSENLLSQYEALEHQTDPHFLFNSLNTLSGLISIDTNKAQEYLQHLALSYRYIMQRKHVTTLNEEVDFTNNYLAMMHIRYGDALKVHFDIDDSLLQHTLPHISLQLLIENAIKHNVVSSKHPLTIYIKSDSEKNSITVANTLQPKIEHEVGAGIGLSNLTERYKLLGRSEPVIKQTDDSFVVTLPLTKPEIDIQEQTTT